MTCLPDPAASARAAAPSRLSLADGTAGLPPAVAGMAVGSLVVTGMAGGSDKDGAGNPNEPGTLVITRPKPKTKRPNQAATTG